MWRKLTVRPSVALSRPANAAAPNEETPAMKRRRFTDILLIPVLAGSLAAINLSAAAQTVDFRTRVEATTAAGAVDGLRLLDAQFLQRLYRSRGFAPLWADGQATERLLGQARVARDHGLVEADFPFRSLAAAQRRGDEIATELIATELLARLVVQLAYGRLDPEIPEPISRIGIGRDGRDPATLVVAATQASDLTRFLEKLAPSDWRYQSLRQELANLRNESWASITPGSTLELGATGPRVGQLRRRLGLSGGVDSTFDEQLQRRVRAYQRRHGLEPDGRAGTRTVAALRRTPAERYAQVQINLERLRWILNDIGRRHVLINIAGFQARAYVDDKQQWAGRVQVGTRYRQTPSFAATISSVVFNPTWTVPYTILRDDVLPEVRANVDYLRDRQMDVVTLDGEILDPETLDWEALRARRFPYRIRQRPGADNALGRLKVLFPNPHYIYMHDTPSRALFESFRRDFSSGCIRIEDPLGLTAVLFRYENESSRGKAAAAEASRKTQRIPIEEPWDILIHYGTATAQPGGQVVYHPDIYERDGELLEAFLQPLVR